MRHYENLVIIKPTLTDEETKAQLAAIDATIVENGGTIVARDEMGMRKLAYPIEKQLRGYYYVVFYTMEPKDIAEVERKYRINEDMLRFMTMKYDSKREVAAWNKMVETAEKKTAMRATAAKTAEETPAVEEAPVATETEAPATETPAAEATTEA